MQPLDPAPLDAILSPYVDTSPNAHDKLRNVSYIIKDSSNNNLYSSSLGHRTFDSSSAFTSDSVVCIHSMTKLITTISILQLVQKELITLDEDVSPFVPYLVEIQVLKSFNEDEKPVMEDKKGIITVRKMITQTAGFGLDIFDEPLLKWLKATGAKPAQSRTYEGQKSPLLYNPDEKWHYGAGLTWAGLIVEAITKQRFDDYLKQHMFDKLGMKSTTFRSALNKNILDRLTDMARRTKDRKLVQTRHALDPAEKDFEVDLGGGGLFSTAEDYSTFLSAVLRNDPTLNIGDELWKELFKQQLSPTLSQSFRDEMCSPKIRYLLGREYVNNEGKLVCDIGYTLGGSMNLSDMPNGRRKGSIRWLGSANTFWWIDKETGICGVFMTQIYPLNDKVADSLLEELEIEVYRQLTEQF